MHYVSVPNERMLPVVGSIPCRVNLQIFEIDSAKLIVHFEYNLPDLGSGIFVVQHYKVAFYVHVTPRPQMMLGRKTTYQSPLRVPLQAGQEQRPTTTMYTVVRVFSDHCY